MARKVFVGVALLDVDDETREDGSRYVFAGKFFISNSIEAVEKTFRDELMRIGWICDGLVVEITEQSIKYIKELLDIWKDLFDPNDELDRHELKEIHYVQTELENVLKLTKEVSEC